MGASIVEHGAPARGGSGYSEPEKAESGFCEDGAGHADGGLHDERLQEIGQDVSRDEAQIGRTESARGFDKLALAQGEHLGSNEACIADPTGEGKGEDQIDEAGAEKRNEGDGEQDAGKRKKGVGEIDVDDGIGKSAVEACEAAGNEANA